MYNCVLIKLLAWYRYGLRDHALSQKEGQKTGVHQLDKDYDI